MDNSKKILLVLIIIQMLIFSIQTYVIISRTGLVSVAIGDVRVFAGEPISPVVNGTVYPKLVIINIENTNLTINASDANLASTWAVVSLPTGGQQTVNLINFVPYNYTPFAVGRHNVTFFANDTTGNVGSSTGKYFIAGTPAILSLFALNNTRSGLNSSLYVYFEGELVKSLHSDNGTYVRLVAEVIYDLTFSSYSDKFYSTITDINITTNSGRNITLDRFVSSPFLVVYGVDSSIVFNSAILDLYYGDTAYTNESRMYLYKCDQWISLDRRCSGTWHIISATVNNNTKFFETTVNSFSGFGLIEEYCGDNVCSGIGETCASCTQDCGICPVLPPVPPGPGPGPSGPVPVPRCEENWDCSDWSRCVDNYQVRICTDLNNCNTSYHKPYEVQPCEILPGVPIVIIQKEKIIENIIEKERIVETPSPVCLNMEWLGLVLVLIIAVLILVIVVSIISRTHEWLWFILALIFLILLILAMMLSCPDYWWFWLLLVLIIIALIYKIVNTFEKKYDKYKKLKEMGKQKTRKAHR